jgi:beta-barrel assembly-enhancing protease
VLPSERASALFTSAPLAYYGAAKGFQDESMKNSTRVSLLALIVAALLSTFLNSSSASNPRALARLAPASAAVQYDDPYSDFRNARYSNSGLLNERDEIKLGTQLHREVTKKFNLTDVGLARVDRLGQRCARAGLRPNLTYRFHVIQSREINGFSLPGGHVYVTTALVRLANDNELASVLAHEVGHVVARHSLKTLKKSKEYDDVARSLGELTGVAGSIGRDLGVALGQMVGAGMLTIHSRDEEREADFLGVRAMPAAGFDQQGMITMFQKLERIEQQNSNLLGSLFSDHPDAEERISNTRYEIARMKRR